MISCRLVKIGGVQIYSSISTNHFTVTAQKAICLFTHGIFKICLFSSINTFSTLLCYKLHLSHAIIYASTSKILFKTEQHNSHTLLFLLKWNRSDLGTTSTVMSKLTKRKIALSEFQDSVL